MQYPEAGHRTRWSYVKNPKRPRRPERSVGTTSDSAKDDSLSGAFRSQPSIGELRTTSILDQVMPVFDAARVERRVIDAPPAAVYRAIKNADFIDAVRQHSAVSVLFAVRAAVEWVVSKAMNRARITGQPAATLRLADMPTSGEWILLGQRRPNEVAFGAIGRFWSGDTFWIQSDASTFAAVERPGYAKIACHLALRPLPGGRSELVYDVRTRTADESSRRAFLRYWRVTSPFIGVVMRSLLTVIDRDVHIARARFGERIESSNT